MPDRPKPRPAPKAFDVFKPGKTRASATSRPVIVGRQPQVQDHTLVEQHGAPVPNAHPVTVASHPTQPVLKSLVPQAAHGPATATHHEVAEHTPVPATPEKSEVPHTPGADAPEKVSHTGHSMIRPGSSSTVATKHSTLLHHKIAPLHEHVAPEEPEEPAAPNLAVPITPVEQPAGLVNSKTEGKEELLAAMPVEIRRSIASAQGQNAADWNMPADIAEQLNAQHDAAPVPAGHVAAAPAPTPAAEAHAAPTPTEQLKPEQPAQLEEPAVPPPATTPDPTEPAKPEQSVPDEKPTAETAQKPTASSTPIIKTEKKHSDMVVFVIMFILFLLLATVVVMLFLSGSISI